MLTDPIAVVAAAPNPAISLTIVKSDGYGSERVDSLGGGYSSIINHSTTKTGNRHYFQLLLGKDATNPYTTLVQKQTASVSITINRPAFGFTDAEMVNLVKLFTDTLADADVTPAKLLQKQS
jgi:hypothetical protein